MDTIMMHFEGVGSGSYEYRAIWTKTIEVYLARSNWTELTNWTYDGIHFSFDSLSFRSFEIELHMSKHQIKSLNYESVLLNEAVAKQIIQIHARSAKA